MRTKNEYGHWVAEEIAKIYLLGTDMLDITEHSKTPTSKYEYDLIAVPKNEISKVIPVEVKASMYSKSEIPKAYEKIRKEFSKEGFPVIIFYINYMDRTGYLELINKKLSDNLLPLSTDNLREVLRQVNFA